MKYYKSFQTFNQTQQRVFEICQRVRKQFYGFLNGSNIYIYKILIAWEYEGFIYELINKMVVFGLYTQKGEKPEKGSQASFITQCLVLTRRSFVNMYRDLGYYWLRLAIYIALCLCVGTIFYDIGFTYGSIQVNHIQACTRITYFYTKMCMSQKPKAYINFAVPFRQEDQCLCSLLPS